MVYSVPPMTSGASGSQFAVRRTRVALAGISKVSPLSISLSSLSLPEYAVIYQPVNFWPSIVPGSGRVMGVPGTAYKVFSSLYVVELMYTGMAFSAAYWA